jgi:hypothetical protein
MSAISGLDIALWDLKVGRRSDRGWVFVREWRTERRGRFVFSIGQTTRRTSLVPPRRSRQGKSQGLRESTVKE